MRRTMEGTSAVLLESGLDENWWTDSIDCYCGMFKIFGRMGESASENHLKARFVPFGALVENQPISAKDQPSPTKLVRKSYQEYSSDMH